MKPGRLIGIVVALGFVGLVVYNLLQSEPVKVIHPELRHSGAGSFVSGAVHNSGSDDQSVSLEIRYYDARGHQLGSDTIMLDHLGDGATRNFSGPPRNLPGDASYSIYLNHGRNPYGN
ncbi:MAG TPA: FxLYD domain-containing protein [Candidatus Binataceae bacterium]|nr:FxLYD domain-containing protein [Candidatus Binataceae bacterium]